ncbi:MAG: ABC transporter permease [Dysgonamonadaceae bacterium]|jgi:ABC-2 type transport system permease protein|nr:ABC transporter permease [Dysgonamonadaceae bacterium]
MKLLNTIEKGISDCFAIWKRELWSIYKDVGVFIFFIIVPIVYPIMYGMIYNTESIHEVPIIVVDESHSPLARKFIRQIDASPDVHVFAYASSLEDARERINRKEAYAILLIPSDFSYKINRGEQAVIALYSDMASILFYEAVFMTTTEISIEMGYEILVKTNDPITPDALLSYEYVPFYNPQSGFASFLLPAILILVIQQTLLLGISMLCGTARERNNGHLISRENTVTGILRIVVGKALAYLTIYIFTCFWALVIVPNLFKIPQLAQFNTLLLFALPYLLSCIFFAMTIAGFIRSRETPMMVLVFTSLIFLFISGISWPLPAIPAFWKYVGYLIPSSFGIQGFVKINSMGADLWEIAFEYRMLWLQTGIYFVITCFIYYYQITRVFKSEKQ